MTDPAHIDGEPWEVAVEALAGVAASLAAVAEQLDAVEPQLRNARMTDALQLGASVLHEQYPEAVDEDGWLTDDEESEPVQPDDDPFGFWIRTDDAALFEAVKSSLASADRYTTKLRERQPRKE